MRRRRACRCRTNARRADARRAGRAALDPGGRWMTRCIRKTHARPSRSHRYRASRTQGGTGNAGSPGATRVTGYRDHCTGNAAPPFDRTQSDWKTLGLRSDGVNGR
ncbi:hypothetical protein WJ25_25295 [Burkholderia thailandensis]|nr:hypothetical protein WJ25_25295 [Burkholderia thailandensis]